MFLKRQGKRVNVEIFLLQNRMSQTEEILTNQIEVANSLLQRTLAIPDGEPSGIVAGLINYDESLTRPLSIESDAWEIETLELLRGLYGEDSRQVHDFEKHIGNKNHYHKFRENLESELEHCIASLKALIKADKLKQKLKLPQSKNQNGKTPLVFISHSSKDKDFVEAFVSLLESLGFNDTNLFCSSIPDYWIGLSQDIFDSLHKLFDEYELFVIFIQSPRYYESPISLNEMGAAWALKTNYCSILTKDMQKDNMKGVVGANTIYIKVDSHDAKARLNELKKKLTKLFGLSSISESIWERKRDMFLKIVNV